MNMFFKSISGAITVRIFSIVFAVVLVLDDASAVERSGHSALEDIQLLHKLHQAGALTKDEFAEIKKEILSTIASPTFYGPTPTEPTITRPTFYGPTLAGAATLMMKALNENINLFYSPTQVVAGEAPQGQTFRLGGLVADVSLIRDTKNSDGVLTVNFDVTDEADTVTVAYTGIIPDLFREGQGIVALGKLGNDGIFVAEEVLAKHDENYMPPEVAEALEAARR